MGSSKKKGADKVSPQYIADLFNRNNVLDIGLEAHFAQHNISHLPQTQVVRDVIGAVREDVCEVYLRGSLANGDADKKSDCDIFVVAEPENAEALFKKFNALLTEKYPVIVSCHDRLVKDYGGIGFMYLCRNPDGGQFQIDFYIAFKGAPPRNALQNARRVYTEDPSYCWMAEPLAGVQQPTAMQKFIQNHTTGNGRDAEFEYLFNDLAVTLFIMNKHLARGQVFRSRADDNHALEVCIEKLRLLIGDRTHHYGLYAADELSQLCLDRNNENKDLLYVAQELLNLRDKPIGQNKIADYFHYASFMLRNYSPEVYARKAEIIDDMRVMIATSNREQLEGAALPHLGSNIR